MGTFDAQADRLDAAVADFLALEPLVTAAGPWPLAEVYGTEDEARWGPPEILAHVEEMLPFWLGETERILDGAGQTAVPFGRSASDPVRIGIIGRDRTLPVRELFARVRSDGARLSARMRTLGEADADRTGLHPRLGTMTIPDLLDRFVVSHVEEHIVQLREQLDTRVA